MAYEMPHTEIRHILTIQNCVTVVEITTMNARININSFLSDILSIVMCSD